MHVIKYTMAEVSATMNLIMSLCANSLQYNEYLWSCFSMLPIGVASMFKEQVARDSLANMKAILAFQAKNESKDQSFQPDLVLHEFPLARKFFEMALEENCEHLEHVLPVQTLLRRRFL